MPVFLVSTFCFSILDFTSSSSLLDLHFSRTEYYLILNRWSGGGPEDTDYLATGGLISAAPDTLVRFILVSSVGVDRKGQLPFNILNLFGTNSSHALAYMTLQLQTKLLKDTDVDDLFVLLHQ